MRDKCVNEINFGERFTTQYRQFYIIAMNSLIQLTCLYCYRAIELNFSIHWRNMVLSIYIIEHIIHFLSSQKVAQSKCLSFGIQFRQ